MIFYFTILIALLLKTSGAGAQFPLPPGQKDESLKGAQIILAKQSIAGDGKTAGFVQLATAPASNLTLNLKSSDSQVATLSQSSVLVRAGETKSDRFAINTSRVKQNATVTITAGIGRAMVSKTLAVTVRIDSITVVPSVISGGLGAVGTLVMSGAAPAGAQATLTSSNAQVVRFGAGPFATASATATVNLNGLTPGFSLVGATVNENTLVTITAEYNGVSVTKTVAVAKPPGS
jgi:hypothetical protein